MSLKETTAAVTGATGAVGSVVARRLAREGARVRALVRRELKLHEKAELPGVELRKAELTDRAALADALSGAQLVVHCAAALSRDEAECRRANIDGVRNLVDAAITAGVARLVHVSTVSVYDARSALRYTEDSPLWTEAVDWYGYSKAESERIIRAAGDRLPYVILRPAVIASTHETSYWAARAVERARKSKEPLFPVANMPYVHVENVAEAVVLAATSANAVGQAYNLVDGEGNTADYLAVISKHLGRPAAGLPASAPRVTFVADRVRRDLGYAPAERWQEFLSDLGRLPAR
jgi:nucleoside-diphosphate-sugar epimerase